MVAILNVTSDKLQAINLQIAYHYSTTHMTVVIKQ